MDKEMRFHLEEHIELLQAEGVPPEQARQAALREFGNVEFLKEECRDSWGMRFVDNMIRHLQLTGRQMKKHKGFTAVAILTLALGIGANTALFSLANAVLFRPLSFPDSHRIVTAREWHPHFGEFSLSYPNFNDWRNQQSSFESMGAITGMGYDLIRDGEAFRLRGGLASAGYFKAFGVQPLMGRFFGPEEDRADAAATAIISERLWRARFQADPSIIGTPINLTGELYTVIGILPSVYPLENRDVYTSLERYVGQGNFSNRGSHPGLAAFARLKPGVTLDQARLDLETIAASLQPLYPASNTDWSARAQLLEERLLSGSRPALKALLAASGFLLLIACVNVANMQLVRSHGRKQEFGIRASLGASKRQFATQLSVENLALGLLGGIAGIALAYVSIYWLKNLFAQSLPRISEVQLDGAAFFYLLILCFLASFLFGMAPLRQAFKSSHREALNSGGRSGESLQARKWKSRLIIGEFALTAALLVGAGLMLKSAANLYDSDLGFETDQRLTFRWNLSGPNYAEPEKRMQTLYKAQEQLRQLPGVKDVGFLTPLPLSGDDSNNPYYVEGTRIPDEGEAVGVSRYWLGPNAAEVMGLRLLAGRVFNQFDTRDNKPVAIIDRLFAEQVFGTEDPIGKRLVIGKRPPEDPAMWRTIVGVVENTAVMGATTEPQKRLYVPVAQETFRGFSFIVQTEGQPMALSQSIQKILQGIDPNLPVQALQEYDELFEQTISTEQLLMKLLAVLSALALVLAAVGLYGVLSYSVSQRTREIGVRLAIGAHPGAIRNLFLLDGVKVSGIGLLIGLGASLGLSHFISNMLYGVSRFDWVSFSLVALILGVVGLLACWAPAYRATRTAASQALRAE